MTSSAASCVLVNVWILGMCAWSTWLCFRLARCQNKVQEAAQAARISGHVERGLQKDLSRLTERFAKSADYNARLLRQVTEEHDRILAAVRKHQAARGHESCWLNDCELYREAGLAVPDRQMPPLPEFLVGCVQYHQEQTAHEGGKDCASCPNTIPGRDGAERAAAPAELPAAPGDAPQGQV